MFLLDKSFIPTGSNVLSTVNLCLLFPFIFYLSDYGVGMVNPFMNKELQTAMLILLKKSSFSFIFSKVLSIMEILLFMSKHHGVEMSLRTPLVTDATTGSCTQIRPVSSNLKIWLGSKLFASKSWFKFAKYLWTEALFNPKTLFRAIAYQEEVLEIGD